jgi:hypothetical protein
MPDKDEQPAETSTLSIQEQESKRQERIISSLIVFGKYPQQIPPAELELVCNSISLPFTPTNVFYRAFSFCALHIPALTFSRLSCSFLANAKLELVDLVKISLVYFHIVSVGAATEDKNVALIDWALGRRSLKWAADAIASCQPQQPTQGNADLFAMLGVYKFMHERSTNNLPVPKDKLAKLDEMMLARMQGLEGDVLVYIFTEVMGLTKSISKKDAALFAGAASKCIDALLTSGDCLSMDESFYTALTEMDTDVCIWLTQALKALTATLKKRNASSILANSLGHSCRSVSKCVNLLVAAVNLDLLFEIQTRLSFITLGCRNFVYKHMKSSSSVHSYSICIRKVK